MSTRPLVHAVVAATKAPLSVSIIVPAYNEAGRIGRTLEDILSFIRTESYVSEVLVIDDGSTDETAALVDRHTDAYRSAGFRLRLVRNQSNRGKGYSVKRGIEEATGTIVLLSDADLSAPIAEAPKLLVPLASGAADVVFGSRALRRELITVRQPRARDFAGRTFNLLVRLITRLPYADTQCGFKAFRRERVLPVFRRMRVERFGFDPEMLYIARMFGLGLLEVPVVWNHSEGSKVRFMRDSLRMLLDLLTIRVNHYLGYYERPQVDAYDGDMCRRAGVSGKP